MSATPSFREVPRATPLAMLEAIREDVKPTALDRLVSFLSPERAARRLKARVALAMGGWSGGGFLGGSLFRGGFNNYPGGYKGARLNRRETQFWNLRNNSANADSIYDLPTLRERSRDLVRNAPLASGAIGTVCMNVVGPGLQLQSMVEPEALNMTEDAATEWQTKVEQEFRLWADSTECDITRTQNFYGLQNLAFRSALESGDVLALLPMVEKKNSRIPYTLRVQLIEGDRLCNPMFRLNTETFCGGVEMDDNGAPVRYHVLRKHPGSVDRIGMMQWDQYEAFGSKSKRRNVLHLFERTRPGQTRGVPYLAPVLETIKQLDRYAEAEVMAAVVAAMFTVFVSTERSEGFQSATGMPGAPGEMGAGGVGGDETRLGPGAVVELNPGEDIKLANPGRPNQAFDGFVQAMARQIGTSLGLPFEVLMKHFTASYSASRAALLDAWRFFRMRREWLADMYCQPIYEAWMDEAVSTGRVTAPGYFDDPAMRRAYLSSHWLGDAPIQIDPVKEAAAAEKLLGLNITTLSKVTAELNGGVWTDNIRQAAKERKMLAAAGLIVSTTQVGPPMVRETVQVNDNAIPEAEGTPAPGEPAAPDAPGTTPPKSPAPAKKPATPAPAPVKPGKAAKAVHDRKNLLCLATLQIDMGRTEAAKATLKELADSFNAELKADGTLDDLQTPPPPSRKKKTKDAAPEPGEEPDSDEESGEDETEDEEAEELDEHGEPKE